MAGADDTGRVKRVRTSKRDSDVRGDFTIVAVPGTHRDRTKKKYGRHTGTRALPKADKQRLLLEARRDGHSWRAAAKIAGYRSVGSAYEAAAEAIADIPREAADEARAIELQRLDEIVLAFMPAARRRDPDAGNIILRAIDRRAKMLGLDLAEPDTTRIDVRLQAMIVEMIGMPVEEFERTEREMLALIDASQRSADREGREARAEPSGVGA